jgi:hypothetical protein
MARSRNKAFGLETLRAGAAVPSGSSEFSNFVAGSAAPGTDAAWRTDACKIRCFGGRPGNSAWLAGAVSSRPRMEFAGVPYLKLAEGYSVPRVQHR